jgi:hypothetical protein
VKLTAKEENIMSITRRQFLLSTAGASAGFILPSFYFRALEFFERFGEPFLVAPDRLTQDLNVLDVCGEYLELNLGDPYLEPPRLTFREYFERYSPEGIETFEDDWDLTRDHLDDLAPDWYIEDCWTLQHGSAARAYHLLSSLDLGDELTGPNAVGGLEYILGPFPGSNYTAVCAQDEVTLSLLQQRLNDLGTGIRVVTGFAV